MNKEKLYNHWVNSSCNLFSITVYYKVLKISFARICTVSIFEEKNPKYPLNARSNKCSPNNEKLGSTSPYFFETFLHDNER